MQPPPQPDSCAVRAQRQPPAPTAPIATTAPTAPTASTAPTAPAPDGSAPHGTHPQHLPRQPLLALRLLVVHQQADDPRLQDVDAGRGEIPTAVQQPARGDRKGRVLRDKGRQGSPAPAPAPAAAAAASPALGRPLRRSRPAGTAGRRHGPGRGSAAGRPHPGRSGAERPRGPQGGRWGEESGGQTQPSLLGAARSVLCECPFAAASPAPLQCAVSSCRAAVALLRAGCWQPAGPRLCCSYTSGASDGSPWGQHAWPRPPVFSGRQPDLGPSRGPSSTGTERGLLGAPRDGAAAVCGVGVLSLHCWSSWLV